MEDTRFIPQINNERAQSGPSSFIVSNTKEVTPSFLREKTIIPVFAKDNESTISHTEFIDSVYEVVEVLFRGEIIQEPEIRVSHPIKGRIPSAMGKPANSLLEHEKTLYYERMAFSIQLPGIRHEINGNSCALTIGGVRAYNQENLYSKKTEEKFKVFVGFQNFVCTNLCVSTDGFLSGLKARSVHQIAEETLKLIESYNMEADLRKFRALSESRVSKDEFIDFLGMAKIYHQLKPEDKVGLPKLPLGESQLSTVARDYCYDPHFKADQDGSVDGWRLFNLFTNANKSSYIDTFLERNVECLDLAERVVNR